MQLEPQPAVQAVVALIVALAAAGVAGWVTSHHPFMWPLWLALPLAAGWAWREAAVQPRLLRWDGQAWWLTEPDASAEMAVSLSVLIDLDGWLLLRAAPGSRWLPLSRRQQSAHWTALRATLFAGPSGVPSP
ncbi:hypothetical protein [Roseateles asaccharophilus]|uniref:Toxin CptA n=1 Tax=Roseateles asaccharophilus TaxID=582607 RepID=A0ABU2ADS6_9BURK|nr:hypothetical protein [Roseateles asaccharophilus]MDR7334753.1 hypothetical protein [Roseateles asaccharophilus]